MPQLTILVFLIASLWAGCEEQGPAIVASATPLQATPPDTGRAVAVTIDDLPVVRGQTLARRQQITSGLLSHLRAHQIPAIGFVNEQKLGEPEPQAERVALLEQWLEAGFDLGNHTYAHPSLYTTPLDVFKANVVRGETVTRRLLQARGKHLRYFRHPYLNTGPDAETKAAFESFLAERGYTVAPVTIDNDEYLYALAYDRAEAVGDSTLMARIGEDYVRYMDEMFAFYEQLSQDLLGREPAQVLLLHANALNAAYLGDLARMMQARGYRFISLDEALQDSAYALPDTYTGQSGLSWLQRWWITQGHERRAEPEMAAWVREVN